MNNSVSKRGRKQPWPGLAGICFAVVCVVLAPAKSWSQTDNSWLYTVEAPILGQSESDRQEAAGVGLLQVLTRLTGLTSVPRNTVVAAAVADPARYYSAFDFVETDAGVRTQRLVRIVFQRESVLDLIEQANLPLWWEERPVALLWIVVQDGGQRRILSDADKHPIVTGLRERAAARGVHLQLPMMDLTDALEISAADVWGRVSSTIARASARYAPGMTVVGRFNTEVDVGIRQYTGQWEVWKDAAPAVVDLNGADADAVGVAGVDALSEWLVEQYVVLPRGQRQTRVLVNNVVDMHAYAQLIGYLQSLTFLQQVQVRAVQGNQLLVDVYGQAQTEQLAFLLTSQARLRNRPRTNLALDVNRISGADLSLDWHG